MSNVWEQVSDKRWSLEVSPNQGLEILETAGGFNGYYVSHGEYAAFFWTEGTLQGAKLRIMKTLHDMAGLACDAAVTSNTVKSNVCTCSPKYCTCIIDM